MSNDSTQEDLHLDDVKALNVYCYNESGVMGPITIEQLKQHMNDGAIDGMTYCWYEGMQEWRRISDVESLRRVLILEEAENDDDTVTTKDPFYMKDKQETGNPHRVLLQDVPPAFKYVTQDDVGQVYDQESGRWMDFTSYNALVQGASSEPLNISSSMQDTALCSVPVVDEKKQRNIESRRKYRERLKRRKEAGLWIKGKTNPNVYVKGLPPHAMEEELANVFRRAGVIKVDPNTCLPKVKFYRQEDGKLSGDALISFVHQDSVNVAIKYLNGFIFKDKYPLSVEQAEFQIDYKKTIPQQTVKERGAQRKKYIAAKLEQQRLLAWVDGASDGRIRIMLVRPLWSYKEAQRYPEGDPFYKDIACQLKEAISEWTHVISVTPIEVP